MSTDSEGKRLVGRRHFLSFTCLALGAVWSGCRKSDDSPVGPDAATFAPGSRIAIHGTNTPAKWPDNVAGRFFVNNDCIDCDLCQETAPAFFKRNDKDGYCFVYKQPSSGADLKLCREAMEGCPVEAIVDAQSPKQP